MPLHVDEDNLKQALLGLVVALVEIISDLLKLQAVKRLEAGRLKDADVERLGSALWDLEQAIETLKLDHDLTGIVDEIRTGLDDAVEDVLSALVGEEIDARPV
ncbi:MAG: gas vesicle protein GvpK [Bacillota bacterium]